MTTPPDGASAPTIPAEARRRVEPLARAERIWLVAGVSLIVAFMALTGFDLFHNLGTNSHGTSTVAPDDVAKTAPFDRPGTYRAADGTWDAVVVAYAFGFLPREDLVVPVGAKVRFHVASVDVVHGFQIPGETNVNLMVIPGHVSETTQTFRHPGRFLILCHEYCGSGHHFMTGHIRVVAKGEDPAKPPPLEDGTRATSSVQPGAMEHGAGMDHMEMGA